MRSSSRSVFFTVDLCQSPSGFFITPASAAEALAAIFDLPMASRDRRRWEDNWHIAWMETRMAESKGMEARTIGEHDALALRHSTYALQNLSQPSAKKLFQAAISSRPRVVRRD